MEYYISPNSAMADELIICSNELKSRTKQCLENPCNWRNVTTQDKVNTLVLVQELSRCEFGVIRSFEFFENTTEICQNVQIDKPAIPALVTIHMHNGQEHISGFSDDDGVFSGLKIVPDSIRRTLSTKHIP